MSTLESDNAELMSSGIREAVPVPDHSSVAGADDDERRAGWDGEDRRSPSIKSFIFGALTPRRRRIRRDGDRDSTFIDWYPTHLLAVTMAIMCLSVVDGILTVHLVSAGAEELNPLLAIFLYGNSAAFALIKIFLTAVGVISLVMVSQARLFKKWSMGWIIYALLFSYGWLVMYSYDLSQTAA